MSTVESIARPRRNGERRRAPTASISKESPAITGVVEMVIRRPIGPAWKPRWEGSCVIRAAPVGILDMMCPQVRGGSRCHEQRGPPPYNDRAPVRWASELRTAGGVGGEGA